MTGGGCRNGGIILRDAMEPDTATPNAARMYDYFLGGKDNFAADRAAADQVAGLYPEIRYAVLANRQFHQRAARWMARAGIRQFLDVGCGLPTMESTHQAVRREAPDARVVYADNEPVVIAHARALLADQLATVAVAGDAREPEALLRDPVTRQLLDLSEPTGVLITAVLHFVAGDSDPAGIVARYMAALAPGSAIAVSHGTADNLSAETTDEGERIYAAAQDPIYLRSFDQVRGLFTGLELVPPWKGAQPGITDPVKWAGPDMPPPEGADRSVPMLATHGPAVLWCGVALKAA